MTLCDKGWGEIQSSVTSHFTTINLHLNDLNCVQTDLGYVPIYTVTTKQCDVIQVYCEGVPL